MEKLFTVYRSSAGSGKTETLVKEYLKLSLNHSSPLYFSKILAITFTNKAAEEMRERILTRLKALSNSNDARTLQLIQELCAHCKVNETTLRVRASEVLVHILHNYHRFHVSTIDRFIYSVIRAFANDLGVQPEAEIISDNEKVLSIAVNRLLEKTGVDASFTTLLTDFMRWRQDEGASWSPEGELMDFGKQIFEEDSRIPLNELGTLSLQAFMDLRTQLREKTIQFEQHTAQLAAKAVEVCVKNNLQHDDFHLKSRGILNVFEKMAGGKWNKYGVPAVMDDFISGNKKFHASLKGARLQMAENCWTELCEYAIQLKNYFTTGYNAYLVQKETYQRMYSLSLLTTIYQLRNEYLEERGAILLADFHRLVAQVVSDEPAPFLYERTGERFNHFFIDEFQDTSQLQWGNLLPLVENGLSAGFSSLVVGDAKQSIYRWRNGKVEQFIGLPKLPLFTGDVWKEREQALVRNYQEKILGDNWRSGKHMVTFNNQLFEAMSNELCKTDEPDLYAQVYRGNLLMQHSPPSKTGGYVSINFIEKKEDKEESLTETLEKMHAHVTACIHDGYRKSDICVLVRTNAEGDSVSRYLVNKGHLVSSGNAMLLKNFPEIRLLMGGLRALLAPRNESDKGLFMLDYLMHIKHENYLQVFQQYAYVKNYRRCYRMYDFMRDFNLEISEAQLRNMTYYEIVVQFAHLLQLPVHHVAISQLLEAVHAYRAGWYFESAEWFSWWDSVSNVLTAETGGGNNAITVMTVHKAKGLQFPIVIMPFCNWKIDKTRETEWIRPQPYIQQLPWALVRNSKEIWEGTEWNWVSQQEDLRKRFDQMNLLYVAFTRPTDRLYVISAAKKDSVYHWLQKAVPHLPCITESNGFFETGEKYGPQSEVKTVEAGLIIEGKHTWQHWTEKLRIAYTAPDSLVETSERTLARKAGVQLHTLLAQITDITLSRQEIEELVKRYTIDSGSEIDLADQVYTILQHDTFQQLHQTPHTVFNEREWLDEKGNTVRPDRVLAGNGSCSVIDYKTGKPSVEHAQQMQQYCDVLQRAGYSQVNAYLFYVNAGTIQKVN